MTRAFHYTKADRLLPIMMHGIRLAEAGVSPPERPAVWLTTSEVSEPTALAHIPKRQHARVEVEGRFLNFDAWRHRSGVPDWTANALEAIAIEDGSDVRLWLVSFRPIRPAAILSMSVLRKGAWVDVTRTIASKAIRAMERRS